MLLNQVSDAIGDDEGFPGTGTGDDKHGAVLVHDGLCLGRIFSDIHNTASEKRRTGGSKARRKEYKEDAKRGKRPGRNVKRVETKNARKTGMEKNCKR